MLLCHFILPNLLFLFLCLVGWICFLTLEKWPFEGDVLFARVPPMWAVWALLLWWADYWGWSGRWGWPSSSWLPDRALCGGCLLLVGGARSQLAVESQVVLELVLAHWWAELVCVLLGCRARAPRSSVGLLARGAGCRFQCVLKLVLACWWVELDPWATGWRVQGISELVFACGWVGWVLGSWG